MGGMEKLYKAAEAKEKVCLQATGGKYQFGAAHLSGKGNLVPFAYVPSASAAAATSGPPEGALEGYFDALAAAASTDQNVLAELVESVAKLTKTNVELVQAVASLTKANEVLRNPGQQGGRTGRGGGEWRPKKYCKNFKMEVVHPPDDCFELKKNKEKRFWGWVIRL